MNDLRSDYWRKNLNRTPTRSGDPNTAIDAAAVDSAVAIIDAADGIAPAAALIQLKDGRHMFLEQHFDESGTPLSESCIIGPREKCELGIPPETRKRLGLRAELRREP